jgi:hypothetical protein
MCRCFFFSRRLEMGYAVLEGKNVDIGGIEFFCLLKLLLGEIKLKFFEVFVGSKETLTRSILGSIELRKVLNGIYGLGRHSNRATTIVS